ncbi:PilZ domain-containing protein [Faunimonas sp. B44]|uniref:PilZ domain-containing protein n=1 Tax=Faunimonas sp. B44 TaxID=3461493 RepID=UPI0040448DDD
MTGPASGGEKRSEARRRTRLRSGKVLDTRNAFLIECLIHDRSDLGARLRLVEPAPVPDLIHLFEDDSAEVIGATVVWRRGQEIGVRFELGRERPRISGPERASLAGRFYAVGRGPVTRR